MNNFYDQSKNDDDNNKMQLWCWINMRQRLYITAIYIIYWAFILYNLITICKVFFHIKRRIIKTNCLKNPEKEKANKICNRLILYPTVHIICHLFATIQRLSEIFYFNPNYDKLLVNEKKCFLVLYIFHSIFYCSRGFIICLIYGFDNEVQNEVLNIFRKCFKINRKISEFL